MDYTNLDEILERAEKFNKMIDIMHKETKDSLYEVEQYILFNESLIKILKISKILKTAYADELDFNELLNIDNIFKCDGEKITVKFSDCPIEYTLTYTDYDGDERFWADEHNIPEHYGPTLYKFYERVLENITFYEQAFIKKLNNIFKKQDADFNKFCSFYLEHGEL
jgi:hypothetical protein